MFMFWTAIPILDYASFDNDSAIVNGIANVFPIFFFLVAALVCITTMNRMVEEQRTQIGVLKALGYSEGVIMGKYHLFIPEVLQDWESARIFWRLHYFPVCHLAVLCDYVHNGRYPVCV